MYMYFPTSTSDLCPSRLLDRRSFESDVTSTANSFKHWDTCMDNKVCKIIAIVGIVLAVILFLWIVLALVRCICMGITGCCELCCFCCMCCRRNQSYRNIEQNKKYDEAINNPNMYGQPLGPPVKSAYQPNTMDVPPTYASNPKYDDSAPLYQHQGGENEGYYNFNNTNNYKNQGGNDMEMGYMNQNTGYMNQNTGYKGYS